MVGLIITAAGATAPELHKGFGLCLLALMLLRLWRFLSRHRRR